MFQSINRFPQQIEPQASGKAAAKEISPSKQTINKQKSIMRLQKELKRFRIGFVMKRE